MSYSMHTSGNRTMYETDDRRVIVTYVPDWESLPKVYAPYVIHEYDKRYIVDYWFYSHTDDAAHKKARHLLNH